MITFSALTVSVEAFRIKLFNMIIDINNRYSEFTFEAEDSCTNDTVGEDLNGYYPSYIPEGYKIDELEEYDFNQKIKFKTEDNKYLYFNQKKLETAYQVDTENAKVSTIYINEEKAILSIKNEYSIIVWANGEYTFSINGQLEKEEIVKMARSVKFNK